MMARGFALVASTVACIAPRATESSRARPERRAAAPLSAAQSVEPPAAAAPARRSTCDPVTVRLNLPATQERVVIGAPTRGGATIERAGKRVSRNGEPPEEQVEIAARDGLLAFEGQHYRGVLRVRASATGPGLEVENVVALEDYVAGVVAREVVLSTSSLEELRAQAIASRSYALAALDERGRKRGAPYLFADVRDQVYAGAFVARTEREGDALARLQRAVLSTRAIALLEGQRIVDARFHAACGGSTANARDVAPEADFECLRAVECPGCSAPMVGAREASAELGWRWTADASALARVAREWRIGARLVRLQPARVDDAGRWIDVELVGDAGSARTSFEKLRRSLGAHHLRSSFVQSTWPAAGEPITDGLSFSGRGRGHGVGMCQHGARELARRGWSAEKILAHYYPGARIERVP